jgi:hypothetical protein
MIYFILKKQNRENNPMHSRQVFEIIELTSLAPRL